MPRNNILRVAVSNKSLEYITAPLYQYDTGIVLKISGITLPTGYQVHFSNEPYGTSTTSIGTDDGVSIPNAYLESGSDIYAWLYLHTGEYDSETVLMIKIPVQPRAATTNEEPTPEQLGEIDQLIIALNSAVDRAETAAGTVILKNGCIRFEIDDNGHLIFYYTDDIPVDEEEES